MSDHRPSYPFSLLGLMNGIWMGATLLSLAVGQQQLDMTRLFEPQPLPTLDQLMRGGNSNPYQWQSAQPYGQVHAITFITPFSY